MDKTKLCLLAFYILIQLNAIWCGRSALLLSNDDERLKRNEVSNDDGDFFIDTSKVLKRDKRYLLWTGGGISKVNSQQFISSSTCTAYTL